jgi:hypothetical protein
MINTTYQKVDEIANYLNALRAEFPGMSVAEMVGTADRGRLELKYVQLLLLANQLIRTSSYVLGRDD